MENIESQIMAVYDEIKKKIPKLNRITFEVTTYPDKTSQIHGFYHIGKSCNQYKGIKHLQRCLCEHEILFRKF